MAYKKTDQSGFTVVELMIAIAVFSVILLIATVAVIQLGRNYQQAATKSRLLDTSREIHAQIAQSYQYGKQYSTSSPGGYSTFCTGTTRYIWQLDVVNALWQDEIAGASDSECESSGGPKLSAKRLLPEGARVIEFDPTQINGGLEVSTRFVIGENDMFEDGDPSKSCISSVIGGEFCAVVPLKSTIIKKV
jgi:prepilin-type N-terminal cleavage/methylation domain-containing protein